MPRRVDPGRIGPHHVHLFVGLGLFQKAGHAAGVVQPHDAQALAAVAIDRHGGDRHVGLRLAVAGHHFGKIHAVELIAREDQHVVDFGLLQVAQVLPDGVGGSLIPVGVFQRLLGGQDFDESFAELIEGVGAANVAMQAGRIELGQHVDPVHAAVDAVRQRNIDQAVFAGERHGWLGANLGERIEPRAATAAQDQGQGSIHEVILGWEMKKRSTA